MSAAQPTNSNTENNPQICVCFDVYADEIIQQIKSGQTDVGTISDLTYACQGCGSCAHKIEALIKQHSE